MLPAPFGQKSSCIDVFHVKHWSALENSIGQHIQTGHPQCMRFVCFFMYFAASLFGTHSTSLTCPIISLSLSPESTQDPNMLFSFSLSALCSHLCTSQGRPSCVVHPSPSVLHSTSPDYCTLPKDIADLVTAQAMPLPLKEIYMYLLHHEASLCADLQITPWRDTSTQNALEVCFCSQQ